MSYRFVRFYHRLRHINTALITVWNNVNSAIMAYIEGTLDYCMLVSSCLLCTKNNPIFNDNGGKQWQPTPKKLPRMQCARAIPVA